MESGEGMTWRQKPNTAMRGKGAVAGLAPLASCRQRAKLIPAHRETDRLAKKGSISFLKKRNKKLLFLCGFGGSMA
jgi:hypothetical protein